MNSRALRRYARAFLRGIAENPDDRERYIREALPLLAQEGALTIPEHFLTAVAHEYRTIFGAEQVTLTSAHRLPKEIKDLLDAHFPHTEVKTVIDPRLMGGALLRHDDYILDGSLLGSLERMKQSLTL